MFPGIYLCSTAPIRSAASAAASSMSWLRWSAVNALLLWPKVRPGTDEDQSECIVLERYAV
jgi:hypothetical protein